jgi:hypothetical protein
MLVARSSDDHGYDDRCRCLGESSNFARHAAQSEHRDELR